MAKSTQKYVREDYLGREMMAGQPVVFYHRRDKSLQAGKITRLSRVNATVKWYNCDGVSMQRSVRPRDLVIIDEDQYVYHILRNS